MEISLQTKIEKGHSGSEFSGLFTAENTQFITTLTLWLIRFYPPGLIHLQNCTAKMTMLSYFT